jgi:hypothetical protein
MRAGGSQSNPLCRGEGEKTPPSLALAHERILQICADARDDLDLGGDQLPRDAVVKHVVRLCRVAQLLEARAQIERVGIEDRKLLLYADGEVARLRERLGYRVEINACHVRQERGATRA